MVETLSVTVRKARKDHEDSAGIWIHSSLDDMRTWEELTFSEWRAIARLKANSWMIKKGQTYEDCICKQDGELYSFKCLPEINKICQRLSMYDDC